jgi:serine/threonine protein kinase
VTSSDRWRRLEEVFQSALDIPQERRPAYLESVCGDDVELRQEIESLLARDDKASDAEENLVIAGIIEGAAASLFDDETPADAMVGAELGNYRIIREIGRGGMGAVYLAVRADQAFEKQVAIKLVKRGIDTDSVLQRFWYERRILAGLEHPYIARLIDGGTSPDGRPYFVMEYVDGRQLDAYVREEDLSIHDCCELFRKICEAVSYAHRNLIIHRDIKPGNILVTADGTPKLLDFGIARLLSVDPGQQTLTGPVNALPLTPEFASPEQARGEAVTTATDVYSLGATLCAVLPSDVPVPADLATIAGKALREESEQRYASVAELSDDLRRYLTGLPIMAREQTLAYQASKFVRRHRFGVTVFLAANLLIVAGVGGIVWESRKADVQRKEAEQRLSQAVAMAEQTLKDVNSSIASLPGTTQARRQMVHTTLDYLNTLSKDSGGDPRVLTALATAYVRVGEVLGNSDFPNLGDLPGALATYKRALGVIQPLLAKEPNSLRIQMLASEAHQGTCDILESQGQSADAETECQAAVDLASRALAQNPDDPETQYRSIDAQTVRGRMLYTAHPAETEKDMRQQLPMAVRLAAADPENLDYQNKLSEVESLLGTTANRLNRLPESLEHYRKAAEVRERIYHRNSRNTRIQRNLMIVYGHIGDVLGNPFTGCLGDYRGALEYFEKAARIAEDMHRADPSDTRAAFDVAMIQTRLGATRQAAGDLKPASEDLDRAIVGFEALLAGSPGNAKYAHGVSLAYEYLGTTTWHLGDRGAALGWYRKSLAVNSKLMKADPHDVASRIQQVAVMGPVATLLALAGDRAGALKIVDELIKESAQLRLIHMAYSWAWCGQAYEALADFPAAATAYGKSAEAWKIVPAVADIPPYQHRMREAERKAAECRKKVRAN